MRKKILLIIAIVIIEIISILAIIQVWGRIFSSPLLMGLIAFVLLFFILFLGGRL